MRLFIAGDTHGNTQFWTDYLLPQANRLRVDAIVQVGDFGFWTHVRPVGDEFLDAVNDAACAAHVIIHVVHGNHDNWSKIMADYGHRRDDEGFVIVRSHILYIPQGHIWTWDGLRMRAFGGAYSVDKDWRLKVEAKRQRALRIEWEDQLARGDAPAECPSAAGTLWFPDEEMTDADFAQLMIDDAQTVDVIFSHDTPRGSDPKCDLKNIPECHPNQDRLQLALETLTPRFWFHGHLHHRYQDEVGITTVIGLACDNDAGGLFWRPSDSWCVLETHDDRPPSVVFPPDVKEVAW